MNELKFLYLIKKQMNLNALAKPLYYLLFLSVLFTSCNGQDNTTALTEKVNE